MGRECRTLVPVPSEEKQHVSDSSPTRSFPAIVRHDDARAGAAIQNGDGVLEPADGGEAARRGEVRSGAQLWSHGTSRRIHGTRFGHCQFSDSRCAFSTEVAIDTIDISK